MRYALIFLNGYYDPRYPEFYTREILWAKEGGHPIICADGGIRIFRDLSANDDTPFTPDVLVGDLDSFEGEIGQLEEAGVHIVTEWVGQVDKDYTDGQLAVAYAIDQCDCRRILIYGGLPQPNGYETDHFLGNLKLMRFGLRALHAKAGKEGLLSYRSEMRDALQSVHYVVSTLRLERKNAGPQRVSLVAEHDNVQVESSENLRWSLGGLHVDPDLTRTLRNEFINGADWATIRLAKGSDPVYVIHNWYEA